VKEALEINERIGDITQQMWCLTDLAYLLFEDKQSDASESTASRAIDLASEKGEEFQVCVLHRLLGNICRSKGEKEKAIHHFETALGIASPSNWHNELFWINYSLAIFFRNYAEFDNANVYIKQAKSHAIDGHDEHNLGRATELQAKVWYQQLKLENAKSEALRAWEIYEKLGAVNDVGYCRDLLQEVERDMKNRVTGFEA